MMKHAQMQLKRVIYSTRISKEILNKLEFSTFQSSVDTSSPGYSDKIPLAAFPFRFIQTLSVQHPNFNRRKDIALCRCSFVVMSCSYHKYWRFLSPVEVDLEVVLRLSIWLIPSTLFPGGYFGGYSKVVEGFVLDVLFIYLCSATHMVKKL